MRDSTANASLSRSSKNTAHRITLALAIALHLLAIHLWTSMKNHPAMPADQNPALIVRLFSLPPQPATAPQNAARKQAEPTKPVAPKIQRAPTTSVAPQAAPTPPMPLAAAPHKEKNDASARPPPVPLSTASMVTNALRDIGKIDRDLRKDIPKYPEATPDSAQSRLAKGIAAAAKNKWGTMEVKVFPGGRRMTRITTPVGTYCVTYEGAGATDGIDQIQHGVQQKLSNCDHFFD